LPILFFVSVVPGTCTATVVRPNVILGHIQEEVSLIARPVKREEDTVRINEKIRARQVRVVDEEGNQLGIMSPQDALREAESKELDLVEVAPNATPPVCRIMDYGKFKYEQKRRARESRKNQHTVTVKEIKYRPKIDKHDFEYKTQHVREFLEEGNKVKITVMFRGREMAHPEFGREILVKVVEETSDLTTGEYDAANSRLEGRNMSIVLQPSKTK
jgi:translation initiation factor IF-3